MDTGTGGTGAGNGRLGAAKAVLAFILDVNGYIFLASFCVYLLLEVMEMAREGSVDFFSDPDMVFHICIATGALFVLSGRFGSANPVIGPARLPGRRVKRFPAVPAAAAMLAALLSYRLMSSYRPFGMLIAMVAGVLTAVTAYLASSLAE